MNHSDLLELEKKKEMLLADMTDYMKPKGKGFNPGYTGTDIKKCDEILVKFFAAMQKTAKEDSQSNLLECVKNVVLELNRLNASVGGNLIETLEREFLCDCIDFAARRSGLNAPEGDITEEWRLW
jgi:hypothetical protein